MTNGSHLTQFAGFSVSLWEPGQSLGDPATSVYRIAVEYDDEQSWTDKFHAFLNLSGVSETQGLVVGLWDGEAGTGVWPEPMVEALVARLKKLNVSRHWCSDEMVAKLKALPIEVDATDQQEADEDDWRYFSRRE